jgi:hypothetical protein
VRRTPQHTSSIVFLVCCGLLTHEILCSCISHIVSLAQAALVKSLLTRSTTASLCISPADVSKGTVNTSFDLDNEEEILKSLSAQVPDAMSSAAVAFRFPPGALLLKVLAFISKVRVSISSTDHALLTVCTGHCRFGEHRFPRSIFFGAARK